MIVSRNGEATQQRLIDSALSLYAQRGYAGTCLEAILRQASSSKGAFYHHFDSKETLTARAIERHWRSLIEVLQAVWDSQAGRSEKLAALVASLKRAYDERAPGGCPLGLLGFESRSLPPQVQAALTAGLEDWTERIAAMLGELGLEDRDRAKALALQLFVMFEGGVLIERLSGLSRALDVALEAWRKDALEALEGSLSSHGQKLDQPG
jgi:TetR/AcrR family transcriptional regulator, transcriptional repressor for nem operon